MNDTQRMEQADRASGGGVVVGVDGSPASRIALSWAAHMAHRNGAGLRILHAVSMPLIPMPFTGAVRMTPPPEVADGAAALLSSAVEHVGKILPELAVDTEVSSLDAATALIDASERAAMVVVGSRGLGGLGSVFLGSVSVRVTAHAHSPVVVVPGDSDSMVGEHPSVVVGIDDSPAAFDALVLALTQAARLGGEVTAVHAWEIPASADPSMVLAAGYAADRESIAANARRHFQGVLDEARSMAGTDAPVRLAVVEDHPARALLAKSRAADLLVVGSRGRGGFRGLLLGSVSQSILHHTTVPVLVTRAGNRGRP